MGWRQLRKWLAEAGAAAMGAAAAMTETEAVAAGAAVLGPSMSLACKE